jgi:hypothetical protein
VPKSTMKTTTHVPLTTRQGLAGLAGCAPGTIIGLIAKGVLVPDELLETGWGQQPLFRVNRAAEVLRLAPNAARRTVSHGSFHMRGVVPTASAQPQAPIA